MKNMLTINLFSQIFLFFLIIILDQYSKIYMMNYIPTIGYKLQITEFLDFRYAWNYGISFGFFDNHREYSNIFFAITNSAITIYIFYLIYHHNHPLERYGYIMVAAGAIGNILDRIKYGAVFDFILLHYNNIWHFAIFNIADMFISIGIILLILRFYVLES